jgi:orotate phosphoribosyltransferase
MEVKMNVKKCSHVGPKDGDWYNYFVREGVIWNRRNGNNQVKPKGGKKSHDIKPHVRLSGGKHADMYMNPDMVCDPGLIQSIAEQLIVPKNSSIPASEVYKINRVVAPQKGGSILAYALATAITNLHDQDSEPCKFTLLQKEGVNKQGPKFKQIGNPIQTGDAILICNDVLTTARTVLAIDKLVQKCGARTVFVAVLAIDSSFVALPGLPVNALCIKRTKLYDQDNCPLCRKGSRLITSPKEHWKDLVGV